jgi:hypothetical protein
MVMLLILTSFCIYRDARIEFSKGEMASIYHTCLFLYEASYRLASASTGVPCGI